MATYEHLANVPSGDRKTAIEFSLGDHQITRGGRSGYAPAGNYRGKVTDCLWKEGGSQGRIIELAVQINGQMFYRRQTAPLGDKVEAGLKFIKDALTSALSAKPEALAQWRAKKTVKFAPETLTGKDLFVVLRDYAGSDAQFRGTSELDGFLTKDEYDAAPGPFVVPVGTSAGAQGSVPDATAGNSRKPAKAVEEEIPADF